MEVGDRASYEAMCALGWNSLLGRPSSSIGDR